jgi:glycosyltransferase involved in cell wall biosynthesis
MITTFYPPYNFGGDGIFVHRLSNELARRGHHVDVIHCLDSYRLGARQPTKETYADHPNVTVHGLSSRVGFISAVATQQTGIPLFKTRRIKEILDKGFDVIHYHNISLIGGPKILEYGEAIKLYTMHDYWLVCQTHALFKFNRAPCVKRNCLACSLVYKRPPQWWRYFGLLDAAVKHVDAFIAPSRTSQLKHEQLGLKVPMVHVPNFVPLEDATSPTPDRRATEEPYFLFVGRLESLKGLHSILPMFRDYAKAHLRIAGTGSDEPRLRQLAADNGNIRFLGHQSGSALRDLYRNATAVIYPSINFQASQSRVPSGHGAPLVIMEAFSQRTPVLASNLGSIPALIHESGGGIVYSNAQELVGAMDRLVGDPSYRDDLGEQAYRAYQQKWTAEAHLTMYFDLIHQIMVSRQRGAHAVAWPDRGVRL